MKTLAELGTAAHTAERHERGEYRKTLRGRTYASHSEGRRLIEALLPPLANFMLSREAPTPPKGLERPVRQLTPEELAFVALSPLLHRIAVGFGHDDEIPGNETQAPHGPRTARQAPDGTATEK